MSRDQLGERGQLKRMTVPGWSERLWEAWPASPTLPFLAAPCGPTEESPLGCVGSRQPATCGVPPRLVPAVDSDSLRPRLPCTAMVLWKPVPPGKAYPKLKWATALHFPNLSDWFFRIQLKETQDLCIIIVWSCLFLFFLSWCGKKKKMQSFLSMNLAPRWTQDHENYLKAESKSFQICIWSLTFLSDIVWAIFF